jgi:hypothetical protein
MADPVAAPPCELLNKLAVKRPEGIVINRDFLREQCSLSPMASQ